MPPLIPGEGFDLAVAWGVIHHLAEADERRGLVSLLATHVRPGGRVALSAWAFARPRFRGRRLGREEAERRAGRAIPEEILEGNDAFFGFASSPTAVRYVRLLELKELLQLVSEKRLEPLAAAGEPGEPNRWVVARRPGHDRLASRERRAQR